MRAGRAPTSRARNLLHIHRARARIVRHSRISATLAPSSRSPRDEKAPCASRLSALRRPLTPSPPPLHVAEDKEKDPATYNILVKKTGPLNVTWNGVGMLQVPRGKDDKESNNVAKTVLIQRKEQVMAEVARLYPKMTGPKDFVIQMFEDPYADPVDMEQMPPEGLEPVPAEIKYMPKGKRYPF